MAEAGALELAEWFDGRNDPDVWGEVLRTRGQCDVVSFSHFLPSQVRGAGRGWWGMAGLG